MNKRLFIFVIILMGISLAGIILLQLFWIKNAVSIREEQFAKSVNAALKSTAEILESRENLLVIDRQIRKFDEPVAQIKSDTSAAEQGFEVSTGSSSYTYKSTDANDYVVKVWTDDGKGTEIIKYKHNIEIENLKKTVNRVKADIQVDSLSKFFTHDLVYIDDDVDTLVTDSGRTLLVVEKARDLNEAFIKLAYEIETESPPIKVRLSKAPIYEVLSDELFDNGINSPFEYAVLNSKDSISFPVSSAGFDSLDINKKYVVNLFPNELTKESNFLIVQFPGRNVHIVKSMAWTLAGSLLLTLIILATFAITIFLILRQKKLSDIKSDFINNMTHEFKTPIATISLAIDSIDNPRIISNEKEVRYYTHIIREENQRMNHQVESVLRMSLLDKRDLEFNFEEYDLHDLIRQAVSKVELILRERNGQVKLNLDAENTMINLDADHFTNAILNLLDNAIKYSEDAPEIEFTSKDTPGGIYLSILDRGMGMSREVAQRAFDKFYRQQTGNIHNIKGFGLGLSYVKAIIDAFGGSINVESEPGKGSIFKIFIPNS